MKFDFSQCFSFLKNGQRDIALALLLGLFFTILSTAPAFADLASDQNSLTQTTNQLINDQQSLANAQQQLTADQQSLANATTAQDQATYSAAVSADNANIAADTSAVASDNAAIASLQNTINNEANNAANANSVVSGGGTGPLVSFSGSLGGSVSLTGGPSIGTINSGSLIGDGYDDTLGGIFCNVYNQLAYFADFYDFLSYTLGAFLIVLGIYGLSKHFEAPAQNHIHTQVLRLTAGSFLMCLPTFMAMLIDTVFVSDSGGGLNACVPGGAVTSGAQTLDVMLENAVYNLQQPFLVLMSMTANMIGLLFIVHGLVTAARHGHDPRTHSPTKIISSLLVGTLMVAIGDSLDVFMGSIFSGSAVYSSVVSWTMVGNLTNDAAAQAHIQGAITAALTVVQMVGIIAFIRGLMILKKASEGSGQATMPQGLTHMIGGVLAINIYEFLSAMQSTFGTDFF